MHAFIHASIHAFMHASMHVSMGRGVVGLGGGVKGGRVEGGWRAREIVGGFKLRWLYPSTTTNKHSKY